MSAECKRLRTPQDTGPDCGCTRNLAGWNCVLDIAPPSQPDARPWEVRSLRIGYPSAQHDWEPIASPAHKITGKEVLIHAQRHFAVRGEHYLTVRLSGGSITSRPVLDDESMADLPVVNGVVEMRLVKLI